MQRALLLILRACRSRIRFLRFLACRCLSTLFSKVAASNCRWCIQRISASSASSEGSSLPDIACAFGKVYLLCVLLTFLSYWPAPKPLHSCHQFLCLDLPPSLVFITGLFLSPCLHSFELRHDSRRQAHRLQRLANVMCKFLFFLQLWIICDSVLPWPTIKFSHCSNEGFDCVLLRLLCSRRL